MTRTYAVFYASPWTPGYAEVAAFLLLSVLGTLSGARGVAQTTTLDPSPQPYSGSYLKICSLTGCLIIPFTASMVRVKGQRQVTPGRGGPVSGPLARAACMRR